MSEKKESLSLDELNRGWPLAMLAAHVYPGDPGVRYFVDHRGRLAQEHAHDDGHSLLAHWDGREWRGEHDPGADWDS